MHCPVCGGPAGIYRFGTCSPKCDRVLGGGGGTETVVALLITIFCFFLLWRLIELAFTGQ